MSVVELLRTELARKELQEEADELSGSLRKFVRAAWGTIKPEEEFVSNWHIDAVCTYLEAVTAGDIKRLQVWVPPVSMKTLIVSILWPAWEWTSRPSIRYWGASYETRFAARLAALSRNLMMSDWYQMRWGQRFAFIRDAEHYFENDRGGTRLATSPESTGQGEHGHRILIDDPVNAREADATSGTVLSGTNNWYDATVETRGIGNDHARIIIMQRLHENDLAGHVLEKEHWDVLALPERFEDDHPFVWRGARIPPAVQERLYQQDILINGDPRSEGELLWPEFRNEARSNALAAGMGSHRAAAQLQQRPAAREGEILKRHWWRFYNRDLFTNPKLEDRRPKFRALVQTVDTPQKDKDANDLVAIQLWGAAGADRYLLDLKKGHMNFTQAKRAILEQARYARSLYPQAAHHCLIENAGYGVELIIELKRELGGVTKLSHQGEGDKILRAEAAAADLESGNCFLPGRRLGNDEFSMPDETGCSADINDFIHSCALFPNATHDDDVDAWSQCMNWLRSRSISKLKTSSPFKKRMGT